MRGFGFIVVALLASGPAVAQDYVTFKSPSGNIICGIFGGDEGGALCDMSNLTHQSYTTPPPDCEFGWGSSFYIGTYARKGELACVNDPVAMPDQARVLAYGQSKSYGGVTCTSKKTGVTCTNADGHGFTIAKARQQLF